MRKYSVMLIAILTLTACEGAKKQLGLQRQAPDEFSVVTRAPLEMPPDYTLRPPRPGAPRPQEATGHRQAEAVVFGERQAAPTAPRDGEDALLQSAGVAVADDDIRAIIDEEAARMETRERPVVRRLLGLGGGDSGQPPASVVDPRAETERLQRNIDEGKPLTEGDTPTIEE